MIKTVCKFENKLCNFQFEREKIAIAVPHRPNPNLKRETEKDRDISTIKKYCAISPLLYCPWYFVQETRCTHRSAQDVSRKIGFSRYRLALAMMDTCLEYMQYAYVV